MGCSDKTKWECDICSEAETTDRGMKPKGWSCFSITDRFHDRTFHNKAICSSCMKLATTALLG